MFSFFTKQCTGICILKYDESVFRNPSVGI